MSISVKVKYRYYKDGHWNNQTTSLRMENSNPSESMLRSKIMSTHRYYDDVEIVDFTVG